MTALFVFLDTHQEAALLRGFQYKNVIICISA
nr:MAG TPA: hypothetical protein [Caudoviricetes sp.]